MLSVFVEVAISQAVHHSIVRHSETIDLNLNEEKMWLWRTNLRHDPDTILVDSTVRRDRPHLATEWDIGDVDFRQRTQFAKGQRSQPL